MYDVVVVSELPNVAIADERLRIYNIGRSFHIFAFKYLANHE